MSAVVDFLAESVAIRPWRQKLLQRTLAVGAIVGVGALVPSIVAALEDGSYLIAISDAVAYAAWVGLLFAKRLPYILRAASLVAIVLYLGVMLMFTRGLVGASFNWLAAPVFMAVLLLPGVYVIVTALVLVVSIAVCTGLLVADALTWSLPLPAWFATIGNYVAVTSFVSVGIVYLLSGISKSLAKERALSRERGVLISEIHHRVKNNLQTMVSLLRLQGAESNEEATVRALARAEVRVMAMAAAHEQMHGPRPAEEVDVRLLAERITGEAVRLMQARTRIDVRGGPIHVPTASAVTLSLLVAELVVGTLSHAPADRDGVPLVVELEDAGRSLRIHVSGPRAAASDQALAGRDIVEALAANLAATLDSRVTDGTVRHTVELAVLAPD
ncbi:MAG: sensor histidine kinase [Spirochaetota bacterium]